MLIKFLGKTTFRKVDTGCLENCNLQGRLDSDPDGSLGAT